MLPAVNWRISKPFDGAYTRILTHYLFAVQKKGRLIEISLRLFFEKNCITVLKNYPGLNSKQKRPGNKFEKPAAVVSASFY